MSYHVLVSAEGPVHTLCKLSSTSYRTACSYTSRVVRERLCWKRSHQPLFLQEDQECARSALLCFCGRPWAQLQRAPQSKPRRLVIAVQLRHLDTKGCLANIVRKHQKLYSLLKTQGGVGKALKLSNFFFLIYQNSLHLKWEGELLSVEGFHLSPLELHEKGGGVTGRAVGEENPEQHR